MAYGLSILRALVLVLFLALSGCTAAAIDYYLWGQSNAGSAARFGEQPVNPVNASTWVPSWQPSLATLGAENPPGVGQLGGELATIAVFHGSRFLGAVTNGATVAQWKADWAGPAAAAADASQMSDACALLWIGESDAGAGTTANDMTAAYLEIAELALSHGAASVALVQIGVGACGHDTTSVREGAAAAAALHPSIGLVDIDAIPIGPDGCHYTGAGYSAIAPLVNSACNLPGGAPLAL